MRARRSWQHLAAAVVALGALAACSSDRAPADGATTIDVGATPVAAIVREPADPTSDAPTVLFLHGQAYSSRIWDDRGILDAVVDAGHRVVAVDLPGYGETPERTGPETDAAWLGALVDELGGPEQVVIVSPSMSGRFSLAYLAERPADRLAGFVPVAPVGADELDRVDGAPDIPVLVVYGEDDEAYAPERAAHLLGELGGPGRIEVVTDGSHAAYDDEPGRFTDALLSFLRNEAR